MMFLDDIVKYVLEKIEEDDFVYPEDAVHDAIVHTINFLFEEDFLKEEIR